MPTSIHAHNIPTYINTHSTPRSAHAYNMLTFMYANNRPTSIHAHNMPTSTHAHNRPTSIHAHNTHMHTSLPTCMYTCRMSKSMRRRIYLCYLLVATISYLLKTMFVVVSYHYSRSRKMLLCYYPLANVETNYIQPEE